MATLLLTRMHPAAGLHHRRARPEDVAKWSLHLCLIRSCQHCKTKYQDAGAASVCEHWHEGL